MRLHPRPDGTAVAHGTSPSAPVAAPATRRPRVALGRHPSTMPDDLRLALAAVPLFESLETRKLLAGAALDGRIVTVTGDAAAANTFAINVNADDVLTTSVNGTVNTFANAGRLSVRVIGGDGADRVTTSNLRNPMTVVGGAGNDTIQGGAGHDSIDAGDGDDVIDGGDGYDTVENGETFLNVESGAAGGEIQRIGTSLKVVGHATADNTITVTLDAAAQTILVKSNANAATYNLSDLKFFSITGGSGNDSVTIDPNLTMGVLVEGEAGDDTLRGGAGNDALYGRDGNDVIYGNGGDDYIETGTGNALADGGAGTDTVIGTGPASIAVATEVNYHVTLQSAPTTPTEPTTPAPVTPTEPTTPEPTTPVTPTTPSTPSKPVVDGAAIPNVGTSASPVARITRPAGNVALTVGEALHVDGLSSTLNAGQVTTARFEWDFGDASGAHNALVGFNAAHVYDRAGTYTVTLRVINETGKAATTTMNVTVGADDRAAIYVSSAGNDANNGATAGTAVRTWERAVALLGDRDDVKILFRRGDAFNTGSTTMVIRGDNVVIGAYGSGADPTLRYSGARILGAGMIASAETASGLTVENLTFDSIYTSTDGDASAMPTAVYVGGTATTVRNAQFLNVNNALNVRPTAVGVLVQDSTAPLATGIRSYFVWNEGTNVVIVGNSAQNSTREHIVRSSGGKRLLIAENDFTNLDRTNVDAVDIAKSTINLQWGEYFYVVGNTVNGNVDIGPLGIPGMDPAQRTTHVVFEGNYVDGTQIIVKEGAEHVTLRNNILEGNGTQFINVKGYSNTFQRGVVDLRVLNNTNINTGTTGNFMYVDTPVEGITVLNNLFVSPNLKTGNGGAAGMYVLANTLSSFVTINGNNWGDPDSTLWAQNGVNWVGPYNGGQWVYRDAAEWNALAQVGTDLFVDLTTTSAYVPVGDASVVNGGTPTGGVFVDYHGQYRSTNGWTIGAVQA